MSVLICPTFAESRPCAGQVHDGVHAYSCESLSLGLLFLEFKDSIREGDGGRVMHVWQYFLLLFKHRSPHSTGTVPSDFATEHLKWSRFVNTHGLVGHNISCDLHMEHLNRLVKDAITGLGANKTTKAIDIVGKAIGTITKSLTNFDMVNNIPVESLK